jgi:hypothetical protein
VSKVVTELEHTEAPARPRTPTSAADHSGRSRIALVVALCAFAVGGIFVAHNARRTAAVARIANPAHHVAQSSVVPLFGWTHWLGLLQAFTVIAVVQLIVIFAVAWWRYPKHPILLMAIVCTTLVVQDPIMNWAPYAVYNPALWHWPENWPLVSISPTVEPFVVIGYVMFYLVPGLIGIWVLRRVQRRRPVTSFVWTHPLITLALLIYPIGFVYDAIQEMILVRTQMYIYAQVIPFGSVFTGKPYQFPLLWESTLVTAVMIPAGVLLYRDDTGRTVAEKLAHRVRAFRGYPALGSFLVMFLILNACYLFLYGGGFAIIRASGAATSVACPYPYPTTKVYDPQGFYEEAGQPGPYSAGIWDGWETGQAGRPSVTPPRNGGRCSASGVKGSAVRSGGSPAR